MNSRRWWRRLWQWLRSAPAWPSPGSWEQLVTDAVQAANELALAEGRSFTSVDDLFLTMVIDEELHVWLRSHGTSAAALVDDVRAALASVDPELDRSGASAPADGGSLGAAGRSASGLGPSDDARPAAVHRALWVAAAQAEFGGLGLNSVLLFIGCLSEGTPSFVRDAFVQRTGRRHFDVTWVMAHGDVDVDSNTEIPASTPMAALVLYNDEFTTQAFVTEVLAQHAKLVDDDANQLMWSVHVTGVATILQAPLEVARAIRRSIVDDARAAGHPLRLRVEPVVDE